MNSKSLRIRLSVRDRIVKAICTLICLFFLLVFAIPIGHVLLSSFYGSSGWSLEGYQLLMENELVLSGLRNSIFLACVGTIYSLCLELPAAYVLAKKKYSRLTNVFFICGLFGVSLVPLYLLLKQWNLLNSLWGLIFSSGISIYYTQLLRARLLNMSAELEDAAFLDGCGHIRYLISIAIPMLGPTIASIGFFHMVSYWSSTMLARTFLTDEGKYPLSLVLNEILIKQRATDVLTGSATVDSVAAVRMAEFALCVIATLPLMGVFLLLKKHIRVFDMDGGVVM